MHKFTVFYIDFHFFLNIEPKHNFVILYQMPLIFRQKNYTGT